MRGRISTSPTSIRSFSSCSKIREPNSRCVISRPRNQIVALILLPSGQPFARALHAIAVVVHVGAGAKLNFLDGDDDLFLLRLVRLLLRFVLKLSEVDDFANGRFGVGRDLNQIHALLTRATNCIARVQHAKLFAIFTDHAHLRHANPFVNPNYRPTAEVRATAASKTCSYVCTS